jgi:Ca2+-binding EF-hand superfamily protein
MRSMGVELSADQTSKLLATYDTKRSGSIDFADFLAMLLQQGGGAAARISAQQIRQMLQAFQRFDTNKSGTIEVRELAGAVQQLGFTLSADELRRTFVSMDRDGSGSIDLAEWIVSLSGMVDRFSGVASGQAAGAGPKLTVQHVRDAAAVFQRFDTDKSGERGCDRSAPWC